MGFFDWKIKGTAASVTSSVIDAVPVVGSLYRAGLAVDHLVHNENNEAMEDAKKGFINLGWDAAAAATMGGAEEMRLGGAAMKLAGRRGLVQLVADPNMSISAARTAMQAANCDTSVLDKIGRKITGATEKQQPDLAKLVQDCQKAHPDPDPKEPVWLADSQAPLMTDEQYGYVAASLTLLALALFFSDW